MVPLLITTTSTLSLSCSHLLFISPTYRIQTKIPEIITLKTTLQQQSSPNPTQTLCLSLIWVIPSCSYSWSLKNAIRNCCDLHKLKVKLIRLTLNIYWNYPYLSICHFLASPISLEQFFIHSYSLYLYFSISKWIFKIKI